MTLQEFIETDPTNNGPTAANLIYSSSISGSDSIPIPPFSVEGLTIPDTLGSTNLAPTLKEVNEIHFGYTSGSITAKITGRQKRSGYFYFTFTPIVVNDLPTLNSLGIGNYNDSEFVFVPFTTLAFNNSDYNPLVNNSEGSKKNSVVGIVDRNASQEVPTNIQSIISQSVTLAEIQDCNYTKTGIINSKYNGSKSTAAGPIGRQYNKQLLTIQVVAGTIEGNEPALSFKEFQGSVHSSDASTTAIKDILQADRDVTTVYFNSVISGSHPNKLFPSFPSSGSFLFTDQENKLVRGVNNKIYSIDTDTVFTTNQLGGIILVE
tara:strand:- start:3618 stop:4577 length:960 start_codon:yes stop_codon:yes gene_type:complete